MKLTGHYIILQKGFTCAAKRCTGYAGRFFPQQEISSQNGLTTFAALRGRIPQKAAVCAERCTDETGSLTASRCILPSNNIYYKTGMMQLLGEVRKQGGLNYASANSNRNATKYKLFL